MRAWAIAGSRGPSAESTRCHMPPILQRRSPGDQEARPKEPGGQPRSQEVRAPWPGCPSLAEHGCTPTSTLTDLASTGTTRLTSSSGATRSLLPAAFFLKIWSCFLHQKIFKLKFFRILTILGNTLENTVLCRVITDGERHSLATEHYGRRKM